MAATTLKEAIVQALNKAASAFYTPQTLTPEQQEQARTNIGAQSSDDATSLQILQAFQDFADEHGIVVPETTDTEG